MRSLFDLDERLETEEAGVGDSVIERAREIVRQQREQGQKPQKNATPSHTELLSKAAAKAQRAMMNVESDPNATSYKKLHFQQFLGILGFFIIFAVRFRPMVVDI